MDILKFLFNLFIFPGFLFCFVAGLLIAGIDRKLVARMQKRKGPPIMQPFYDFMKLMGKETIVPHAASKPVFLTAPYIGLASLIAMAMFIPIYGYSINTGVADLIVMLYLLTIPSVAVIMGGSSSGSPFAGVGLSREMVAMISYEFPLIIIFLAVGRKVGVSIDGNITFSLAAISDYQFAHGSLISNWSLIPAAIAMLFVIPCEVGSHPFDVAEAETEICEGPLVEYSGAPLGIFKLNHAVKMLIMSWLFTCIFIGGFTTGMVAVDAIILVAICIAVIFVSTTVINAISARLKIEFLFRFYWTVVMGLALLSMILVWFNL